VRQAAVEHGAQQLYLGVQGLGRREDHELHPGRGDAELSGSGDEGTRRKAGLSALIQPGWCAGGPAARRRAASDGLGR
jgi:hypothetical protein